jgi:hypothetical protein
MAMARLYLALMASVVAADKIVIDWNTVIRPLSTRPALQVVVNPLITRDCPLAPTIWNLLKELGANDVRFVPW